MVPCSAASVSPIEMPHAHRHAARLAGQVAQAAHRLADGAEARQVAVGAGLAVARDAQHHQAGVQLRQHVVAHAPAFERAGAEVLDQHVGLGDQLAGDVLPFGAAQVERDRALVARLHLPPDGGAFLDAGASCAAGRRVPGASILITSAPNSPSVLPAKGPAISWPISMTRTPCSAAGVSGLVDVDVGFIFAVSLSQAMSV